MKGKTVLEVLIREVAARFGVGNQALPLVQMLLAAMTSQDTGGLAGFLDKFKTAGLGPLVQSWLGGGASAQPISNVQIESVLGNNGGLLPTLTARLGLPRDQITQAIGYLLPALVGHLTPGGNLSANLPDDITSHAQAGQSLLAQAAQTLQTTQRAGGGLIRLAGVIVIIIVLAALYAWSSGHHQAPKSIHAPTVPTATGPSSASEPAQATFGGYTGRRNRHASNAASAADSSASAAASSASAASAAATN